LKIKKITPAKNILTTLAHHKSFSFSELKDITCHKGKIKAKYIQALKSKKASLKPFFIIPENKATIIKKAKKQKFFKKIIQLRSYIIRISNYK
jgi:hypothetical protein